MSDTRELILVRLHGLLGEIPGIVTVTRNSGLLETKALPAAYLYDGDESLDNRDKIKATNFRRMPFAPFTMSPQIFIIAHPRDNISNLTIQQQPAPIGPELSAWRGLLSAAIINDPTLVSLVGTTGQIIYAGCATDMGTGRSMVGQLQMFFEFTYLFQPPQG